MAERFKPKPLNEWPDQHMQAATSFVEKTAELPGVKEIRALSMDDEALLLFTRVKGRGMNVLRDVSGAEYDVTHDFPDVRLIAIEAGFSEPLYRTDLNDYLRKGIKPQVVFEKKVKGPRKQVEGREWFFNEPDAQGEGVTFDKPASLSYETPTRGEIVTETKQRSTPESPKDRATSGVQDDVLEQFIEAGYHAHPSEKESIERASGKLDEEFGIPTLSREQSREVFEKTVQQSLGISTAEFVAGFKRGEYDFSHDRPKHWAIAEVLVTLPFIAGDLDKEALQMAHKVLGWPEPKTPDRQERVEQVKENLGTAEVAEDYEPRY